MAKPRNLKNQILELRSQNLSYKQICEILNCSKSTVCYYLGKNQKIKTFYRKKQSKIKEHPFRKKIDSFLSFKKRGISNISKNNFKTNIRYKILSFNGDITSMNKALFTLDQAIEKITENPKCYLTGDDIDIYNTNSYHFDHIIPRSRGGDNSLENLGICTKQANMSKSNLTPDEFIFLCKKVLEHNGYKVE